MRLLLAASDTHVFVQVGHVASDVIAELALELFSDVLCLDVLVQILLSCCAEVAQMALERFLVVALHVVAQLACSIKRMIS